MLELTVFEGKPENYNNLKKDLLLESQVQSFIIYESLQDAKYFTILNSEKKQVGFIATQEKTLIEFYCAEDFEGSLFSDFLERNDVEEIYVHTNDQKLFNICIDLELQYDNIGYIFGEFSKKQFEYNLDASLNTKIPTKEEIIKTIGEDKEIFEDEKQMEFYLEKNWVNGYYSKEKLVGLGLVMLFNFNFAELGVFVDEEFRGKGIAKYILNDLYVKNYENLTISAGCALSNTASKKALQSIGFKATNRILSFKYSKK